MNTKVLILKTNKLRKRYDLLLFEVVREGGNPILYSELNSERIDLINLSSMVDSHYSALRRTILIILRPPCDCALTRLCDCSEMWLCNQLDCQLF